MTFELTDQGPALTRSELAAYAEKHSLSIPSPLADFLLEHNGGRLDDSYAAPVGNGTNTAGLTFFGVFARKPKSGQRDLAARASIRDNRPAKWLTPFAEDVFGNLFAVSARTEDSGSVWFWDHETNESALVLSTFGEFLESIHVSEPEPVDADELQAIIETAPLDALARRLPSELAKDARWTRIVVAESTRMDVLLWMLDNGHGDQMLIKSAEQGNPAFVKELLARGVDPDEADDRGTTALMKAIRFEQQEIVELLLEAGADLDHKDANGEDAFSTAEYYEFPLRKLLKARAKKTNGHPKAKAGKKAGPTRKAPAKATKTKKAKRR